MISIIKYASRIITIIGFYVLKYLILLDYDLLTAINSISSSIIYEAGDIICYGY